MSQRNTNRRLEALSNAFIDKGSDLLTKEMTKYINALISNAVDVTRIGDIPLPSRIASDTVVNLELTTRMQFVYSGTAIMVQNPGLNQKSLLPLVEGLKWLDVSNPELFAEQVRRLTFRHMGGQVKLSQKELAALKHFDFYFNQNQKQVKDMVRRNFKELQVINRDIRNSVSKAVIKRRKQLIRERVEISEGITRPLTNQEIADKLKREFKAEPARVKRILDTEVHAQNELVKITQAKSVGLNRKMWVTKHDSRVRDSHELLEGKKVGINEYFTVGAYKAQFPGDSSLGPEERINCRCITTYVK